MMASRSSYKFSLGLSVLLHVVLFTYVFLHFDLLPKPRPLVARNIKIITAASVDETKVEAEINRRKAVDQAKKRKARAAERAKKHAAERRRLAALKAKQKREQALRKQAEAARKAKVEEARKAKEHEEKILAQKKKIQDAAEQRLQEQMAEEESILASERRGQLQREIDKYTVMIQQTVGEHWRVPASVDSELSCLFVIRVAPGGTVLSVRLVRSSGDSTLDRSAESAVYKSSPLPVPDDPELFNEFREIRLTVRPEGYLMGGDHAG